MKKNLSNFNYNVIIANIHEAYSFFNQIVKENKNYSNLKEDYIKFLISITPVLPHLSNECLNIFKIKNYKWPEINKELLIEEKVNIVVQINGKKEEPFLQKKICKKRI